MSEQAPNKAGNEGDSVTVGLPDANVRSQLLVLRSEHGTDSPVGHRCTNLLELTESFDKASERRLEIAGLIDRQLADLRQMLRR